MMAGLAGKWQEWQENGRLGREMAGRWQEWQEDGRSGRRMAGLAGGWQVWQEDGRKWQEDGRIGRKVAGLAGRWQAWQDDGRFGRKMPGLAEWWQGDSRIRRMWQEVGRMKAGTWLDGVIGRLGRQDLQGSVYVLQGLRDRNLGMSWSLCQLCQLAGGIMLCLSVIWARGCSV